jgi:hypothetical protein
LTLPVDQTEEEGLEVREAAVEGCLEAADGTAALVVDTEAVVAVASANLSKVHSQESHYVDPSGT